MRKFYTDKRIRVDGEETYLLSSDIGDSGILLTISGPQVIELEKHTVTEFDGSVLKLDRRTCGDDCDAPHCRKCGSHFDPACGSGGVCDGCLIDRASQEAEAVTKAFGGDYEAAARHMGW